MTKNTPLTPEEEEALRAKSNHYARLENAPPSARERERLLASLDAERAKVAALGEANRWRDVREELPEKIPGIQEFLVCDCDGEYYVAYPTWPDMQNPDEIVWRRNGDGGEVWVYNWRPLPDGPGVEK